MITMRIKAGKPPFKCPYCKQPMREEDHGEWMRYVCDRNLKTHATNLEIGKGTA